MTKQILDEFALSGKGKAEQGLRRLLCLSVLAGLFIAFAAAASASASLGLSSAGAARLVSGLVFPAGLCLVIAFRAELFTGNCLVGIAVWKRKTSGFFLLRNLVFSYIGNFAGCLLLAAVCVFTGQFELGGGQLAVSIIKTAAAKTSLPFLSAAALGICCNFLVCAGVLGASITQSLSGRFAAAFIPTAVFVICGFEHCVANMYYIPAGLLAMTIPRYALLAATAGVDLSPLSWGNFLLHSLLPVTAGNLLGGFAFSRIIWRCYDT